jgi:AraC family transcriptional regulator of adaptative response/methylated-DNA-[protein]-cysteine methyltransferase
MIMGTTDEGLVLLEFSDRLRTDAQLKALQDRTAKPLLAGSHRLHAEVAAELDEYFLGSRREFTVPLVLNGTEFQQRVWNELLTIPYGTTRSYAEQAVRLGRPDAVRAVAQANGANRIAIIVPCHRVVGSDGQLTGYGGGLWRKQRLLDMERGALRF